MNIYKKKMWYWDLENIDNNIVLSDTLKKDVSKVSIDKLNDYKKTGLGKKILDDYFRCLLRIYRECEFKTKTLKAKETFGDYRVHSGTVIFDVVDDTMIGLFKATNDLEVALFDNFIKKEHIIKTCQLLMEKIEDGVYKSARHYR